MTNYNTIISLYSDLLENNTKMPLSLLISYAQAGWKSRMLHEKVVLFGTEGYIVRVYI